MDDLERQLERALARKEPSPSFEAKVLGSVRKPPRFRWVSAIAAGVLLVGGFVWQYERKLQERAAGEAAKARLELALRITSVKLQKIRQRVEAIEGTRE